jgi:hypothetical protein
MALGALVGVLASAAGAQGMRMMGGGGAMSKGMILFRFGMGEIELRSDVAKELGLTDAQKGKLDELQRKQMEQMMAMFQSGERPSQEEMQKMMKKRQEDEDKALKEILDAKQQGRLKELWIQRLGNSALLVSEIQKELKMTDAQLEKVKNLQAKQGEANRAVFEKVQNGEIDRSEIREIMEKNNKILNEELGKVLDDEQRAKLKAMGGAEFKFEDQ